MIYVYDTCAIDIELDGDKFIVPEVLAELSEGLPLGFRVKSPHYIQEWIPITLLYRYIQDFELRISKSLKIAEKFLESEEGIEDRKRKLRKQWREDLRSGVLDSVADFQTVLLALELQACLVTRDEGMKRFAREMGCEIYEVIYSL